MSGILCPIRGGPGSQGAIDLSISLAKETGERLHFLYIVNLDFLNLSEVSRTHVLSAEMRGMGEFILLTAQERAHAAGVEAQADVRQGHVMEEIVAHTKEIGASRVVLGRPRRQEQDVFTDEQLQAFVSRLEELTGSTVVLAD